MLSVSAQYKQAINADTRKMLHRVTLASSIVLDQTSVPKMTLNESVGGNSGVMLGTSNSTSLQLTLRNPAVADYTDILVEPESGIELPDGTIEWIPLGKFYVTDSSTSNDYKTVELTCADGMYLMSGEYVSALTYPAPIQLVAREIASQAGVEFLEPTSYPNITIRRKPEKLTLRNAIGYVAGCCGKVARFNRYGQLEFVWYRNTGITIEREQQYLDGFARLNDQPLNVKFNVTGEVERYKVTVNTDDNGNIIATPGTNVLEGETVKLSVVPFYQYALATISATTANGVSVALWVDADGDEYTFVQPDDDVVINATFAATDSVSETIIIVEPTVESGEYSFLQHPSLATAPTSKPYWAIFYKQDTDVGPNAKYYLVWFDSWSLGDSIYLEGDKRGYYINMNGYYYCQGANNGRGQHYWDSAAWQGNGASGSSLSWRMGVGRWCDGYGLLVSNASLDDIFTANEEEVGLTQTSWLVNGVDVREKGALSLYACPDTYSTPLPGKYWMLTNHVRVYKTDADGNYETLLTGSSDAYVLFFDGCVITDLGKYYSFHDGNFLKLTFSKLTVGSYVGYDEFYYTGEKTIDEECYVIIADPDYSSNYGSGGGLEYPIGLYATNLSSSYFNNNSAMICDCASVASETMMFATPRSVGASVTIDYTNPMITAKMVDGINAVVEGVAYTPAKVKCRGNPAFEVGDIVTVPDKDGNYHTVLIIQQTMNFGGGMNATITSPGQTEKKSSFSTTGALSTQIRDVVQEESYHQKKDADAYNSMVVSALNRSMSSMSREVSENGVVLKSLNEWRGETNVALSELQVQVNEHSVELTSIAKWQSDTATSISSIDQRVTKNESSISSLTTWKGTTDTKISGLESDLKTTNESLAKVTQTANANGSSIDSLTSWKSTAQTDIDNLEKNLSVTNESVAQVTQTANANSSSISSLTTWKGTAQTDIDNLEKGLASTNESVASVTQTANANSSSISSLTTWKGTTDTKLNSLTESVAKVEQKADANGSSISSLTTWKGTAQGEIDALEKSLDTTNQTLASVQQTANANGASITSLTNWKGTADTDISNLKKDTANLNNSVAVINQTANANSASIASITSWQSGVDSSIASIQQQANANGTSIGLVVQNGSVNGSVLVQAINGQSTAKIAADKLDIEGKQLNIKVDAANIEGSLTIKQIADGVIPTNTSQLTNDSGYQNASGVVALVNGVVTADYVKALGISTTALTVTNANNQVMFSADAVARSVQMGGFYVDHNSIYTYPTFIYSGLILCSTGTESTISVNGVSKKGWKIVAGTQGVSKKYFGVDDLGYLYAEGANISGTISATGVDSLGSVATCLISPSSRGFECATGTIGTAYASEGIWCKYGTYNEEQPLIEIIPAAFAGTLHGSWSTDTAIAGASDRTKKNTIENQSEIYSKIFDRLNPVTFKYNHGKSDRTHLGLIAQDVEDAVLAEGLTTKEFAPVVYDIDENGNKVNYGIRYEELVSLCIYEIQKLKSRLEKTNG